MIAPNELIVMKKRMVVGAEAAGRIAGSADPFVLYDPEQYALVVEAMLSLRSDVHRVLAELDILRGMFSEKLADFFGEAFKEESPNAGDERRVPVEAVPEGTHVSGGETSGPNEAVAPSGVPAGRAPRKRGRRPKPKGDQASVPATPE